MVAQSILFPEKETIDQTFCELERQFKKLDKERLMCVLDLLGMMESMQKIINKHFSRYDLSQARFVILLLLYSSPQEKKWTAISLARELKVSKPTITGLLKKLEADGMIKRLKNPDDRRSQLCLLSKKGRSRMDKILPDHFSRLTKALSAISQEDLNEFSAQFLAVHSHFASLIEDLQLTKKHVGFI